MILSEPEQVSTYVDEGGGVVLAIDPPSGSFVVVGPVVVAVDSL